MGNVARRMAELGIELPATRAPVADYLACKRSGDLLYVSAKVSDLRGSVGGDVTPEAARAAARALALVLVANVLAELGDLDRVASVDRVRGFVRSAPGFGGQPGVMDGASGVLVEIFGEAGRHARTATGTAELPFGAAVQMDMVVRVGGG